MPFLSMPRPQNAVLRRLAGGPLRSLDRMAVMLDETLLWWEDRTDRAMRESIEHAAGDDSHPCEHCFEKDVFLPVAYMIGDARMRLAIGKEWMIHMPLREWVKAQNRRDLMEEGQLVSTGQMGAIDFCLAQDDMIAYQIGNLIHEIESEEDGTWAEPDDRMLFDDDMDIELCKHGCMCGLQEKWEIMHNDLVAAMLRESESMLAIAERSPDNSKTNLLYSQAVSHAIAAARRLTAGTLDFFVMHCDESRRFKPRIPMYGAFNSSWGCPEHEPHMSELL